MNQPFFPPPQPTPQVQAIEIKGVGMTFVKPDEWPQQRLHWPANVHALADACQQAAQSAGNEGLQGVMIRNPANPYDANAIQVHWPPVGMLCHIPRDTAAWLAPMLDAGAKYHVEVWARVDPEHPDNPGVSIRITPAGVG